MAFLILPTEQDAKDRSAEAWEQRLGRKKHPEDVTEFLWGWDTGKDGQSALIIDSEQEKLTPEEVAALETELPKGKDENWEKPDPMLSSDSKSRVIQ